MRALLAIALTALLPAAVLPVKADWTPVQLGPGGPIIEQDWGLYRPGHGSPRVLDGPILMPVPRPIGMAEPMRQHFEMYYQKRGMPYPGMPGAPRSGVVSKDTPPSREQLSIQQGWYEPSWVHYFPGGVEEGDQPAPKPAAAPKPAEPFFRMWTTPTMPDAVLPTPPYDGPDSIALPDSGPRPRR